jgi:hypothetical protein
MRPFKGSRTEENLKRAFLAGARLSFGHADAADDGRHRMLAAWPCVEAGGEAALVFGHLDYLRADEQIIKARLIESTVEHFAAAVAEMADDHAGMARAAREKGLDELADWFETLAKAGRSCRRQVPHGLESLAQTPRPARGFTDG